MPSEDHLTPFLEAMHESDIARASAHLSDTVELNSPIIPTPFKGRANVTGVLAELLSTIDAFDHVHLGEDGRIETMTIAWRPLPAVVAVQLRLVPKLGRKAMRLVPIDQ